MYMIIPLLPWLPLFPLYVPFPLTWNPPCCDRICPPLSRVAHKLTLSFPSPAHVAPHPKSRPPGVFPDPNIHSLGRHCEPNPYARVQYTTVFKSLPYPLKGRDAKNCMYMYSNNQGLYHPSLNLWYLQKKFGSLQ
jgi:hypothetical protein